MSYIFHSRVASRPKVSNIFITLFVLGVLTSCATQQADPEPIVAPPPQIEPVLSSLPLENPTDAELKFAQAALEQLGYRVLFVDGIWGPRSAAAIQQFEQDNLLATANGRLSELNFTRLSEATSLSQELFEANTSVELIQTTGISAKIDSNVALSVSPQLIITDLAYNVLAQPNPYSETVTQIPKGAGLYIINLQHGWYEVETLERQRGFILE